MAQSRDSLRARQRRLDSRVSEVRSALDAADENGVPDAVAGALDALYGLWEILAARCCLTMNQADDRVRGDVEGETAAALIHVRGAKTHVFMEFGNLTDTNLDLYRDYYGTCRWQAHSDPRPRYAARDRWYARHVALQEILPPLETALRWICNQPEVQ